MKRLHQFLVAIDQLINSATPGGWADETLSARAFRMDGKHPFWTAARVVIDKLFFWQEAHCEGAFYAEQGRRHLAPAYRPKDWQELM